MATGTPLNPLAPPRATLAQRNTNQLIGGSASATFAALTRSQWFDYLTSIGAPQEDRLLEFATSPDTVNNAMAEASRDVNAAFDRRQQTTQRRLATLGGLSAEEQGVANRMTALSRAAADVQAQNSVRDDVRTLQQAVIGNPAPRMGR